MLLAQLDGMTITTIIGTAFMVGTWLLGITFFLGAHWQKQKQHGDAIRESKETNEKIFAKLDELGRQLGLLPCGAREERTKALERRMDRLESQQQLVLQHVHEAAPAGHPQADHWSPAVPARPAAEE
jgi:hypothetical protein